MLMLAFAIGLLLILIFMRIPVFLSLFLSGFVCFMLFAPVPMAVIGQILIKKLDNYSLIAIPFFIFLGNIMVRGESAKRLVDLVFAIVSPLRAGLPIAAVNSCGLFGAISGSSISTLVTIGGIIMPALDENRYERRFSVGILTASSILGIIIPPSVPMIIFAMIAGTSVNRVFVAGILPGLLIMVLLSLYAYGYGRLKKQSATQFMGLMHMGRTFWRAGWSLLLPLILYVGIYTGVFTVTEASVVAAAYAILIETLLYRQVSFKEIWRLAVQSGILSGTLVIIIAGAMTLGEFIVLQDLPNVLVDTAMRYISQPWIFVFMTVVLVLVIGTFLDIIGALAILTPVMLPLSRAYGMDPVHFGIILCLGFGIGYITPPLGLLLYTSVAVMKEKFTFICRSIMPPLIVYVVILFLVAYIPQLSLWLPHVLYD